MIRFNSRQHLKERQEAQPLTLLEEELLISELSEITQGYPALQIDLQRLIYNYEKYKHAYIVNANKGKQQIYESKINSDEME